MPGIFELWIHDAGGYVVLVGWRTPTSIESSGAAAAGGTATSDAAATVELPADRPYQSQWMTISVGPSMQRAILDLALDAALQTTGTTARIGTADLDAVDGGHDESARPTGVQHGVALDPSGDAAAEGEKVLRLLALHGVSEGIVTERADALGQRSSAALGFHLQQGGDLSGGAEKKRGEHFAPGMLRAVPPLGHRGHVGKEVKDFVEISFKASSAQDCGDCFLRERRVRLMAQIRASNSLKRR